MVPIKFFFLSLRELRRRLHDTSVRPERYPSLKFSHRLPIIKNSLENKINRLIKLMLTLALPWGQYDPRGMFGVTPRLQFAADFRDIS